MGSSGSNKKKLGTEIGKAAAEKSRGLFSAEDWQCNKCANVNWARRSTCNMCNAPKFLDVEERTGKFEIFLIMLPFDRAGKTMARVSVVSREVFLAKRRFLGFRPEALRVESLLFDFSILIEYLFGDFILKS